MSRWPLLALIAGGLVSAVLAAVLVVQLRTSPQPSPPPDTTQPAEKEPAKPERPEARSVVLADAELVPGEAIREQNIRVEKIPADEVSAAHFSHPSSVIGEVPRVPILPEEPIRRDKLGEGGAVAHGIQASLASGERALALTMTRRGALGPFLTPGSVVDVVVTLDASKAGEPGSLTLVTGVEVLAVNGSTVAGELAQGQGKWGGGNKQGVLLKLSPQEAELMHLFARAGEMALALRPTGEADEAGLPDHRLQQVGRMLRGGGSAPSREGEGEAQAPPRHEVELLRGGKRERVSLGE